MTPKSAHSRPQEADKHPKASISTTEVKNACPLRKMRILAEKCGSSEKNADIPRLFLPSSSLSRSLSLSLSTFFSLPIASKSLLAASPKASSRIYCRSVLCRTSLFRLGYVRKDVHHCSACNVTRHLAQRPEGETTTTSLLFIIFAPFFFLFERLARRRSPFSACAVTHRASCMSVKAWEDVENSDIDACC